MERFHRTINSVLAKTVAENQRDWDVRLPYVMAAFRATGHDTTGYSPNFLVLKRETKAPPDLVYGLRKKRVIETTNVLWSRCERGWLLPIPTAKKLT